MLLPTVIFALITVGVVIPCMIDVARRPWYAFGRPTKETWLVLIAVLWPFGALAWLAADRGRRGGAAPPGGPRRLSQREALHRHPAWRSAEPGQGLAEGAAIADLMPEYTLDPIGPDDDPQFLLELRRRIHGTGGGSA